MPIVNQSDTYTFAANRVARRLGYGAMQLAGPGVFGPPKDPDTAVAVLRDAVASGVNRIDTSDFCGPHLTNQLIRKALHSYADDLIIVTKIGARRGADGYSSRATLGLFMILDFFYFVRVYLFRRREPFNLQESRLYVGYAF